MKIVKHWQKLSLMAAALVVAAGLVLPAAPAEAASSAALSIAPRKNYTIKSGESVKDDLRIRNLDDTKPLQLSLRVIDFTYTDDGGTPKLMLDKDAPQTAWSLRSYMSVPGKVTIEPGASRSVPISVSIPKEVGAGSYYSAIIYSAGSEDFEDATNVGLSASGVTLVFANVPGKVKQDLKLEKFGAYQEATASKDGGFKYFNWTEPKQMAFTLKNSGNVTEGPTGTIVLRDLFGHEHMIQDINPTGSLALIGQTRTFKVCIKQNKEDVEFDGVKSQAAQCTSPQMWPGFYRAELAGLYGLNGNVTQEFNGKSTFWYLPTWFIFALLIALLIIGYFVWSITDRIRSSRRKRRK